jgi:preprotein translocase subunit SecA
MSFFKGLFPSRNERMLKDYLVRTEPILALEKELQELDDSVLKARFDTLREKFTEGASLEDLLSESFAITREVCDRRLGIWNVFLPEHGFNWKAASPNLKSALDLLAQAREEEKPMAEIHLPASFYREIRQQNPESRPPFRMQSFPVQLIGGMVLHEGKVAEMKTGEGKTLTAVNAVVLNAIAGTVYVVTVNDYLASRDAAWMAPAYHFLGLTNGALQSLMSGELRTAIYKTDIIFGTNSEFGFDYLRDNMASDLEHQVQKQRLFAVVDEVDSVLIDEARTPLIISGQPDSGVTNYARANEVAGFLKVDEDFTIDEKQRSGVLTEKGVSHCEEILGIGNIYQGRNMEWPHLLENAVQAHHVYKRDKDYVVQMNPESEDVEVIIVDEFTGRLQYCRRWSSGLHKAL